jgi:hypothetical protein
MRAKANNALSIRKERASKNIYESRRRGRGKGEGRRRGEGAKGGSVGEEKRRRERIGRAKAIPSKGIRRNDVGQGKGRQGTPRRRMTEAFATA